MLRGEVREATGPRTILGLTYPTPYEEVLGSPVTITDTAEPTDPQMQYTVQASDMPTLAGMAYTPLIAVYMAGKNNDASGRTLAWRFVKWSGSAWTSLHTSSGTVAAGSYWTISAFAGPYGSITVAAGDIFGIKVWCTAGSGYFDYKYRAAQVQATRVQPDVRRRLYKPCIVSCATKPTLSSGPGTPYLAGSGNLYVYHLDVQYDYVNPGPYTCELMVPSATYRLLRSGYGDSSIIVSSLATSATRCPYYTANYLPTQLEYRRLPILVV